MSRIFNVGIIGAGGIAATGHLPQIKKSKGIRVLHLCGRKEKRLKLLCRRFAVPQYSFDWEELLKDESLDGVIVALPHTLHVKAGIRVLEKGKHLFMEKPLCAKMSDAEKFAAIVKSRPDLCVYCRPSFSPEVYRIRELVKQGSIGNPTGAYARASHGGPEIYYSEVADTFRERRPKGDLWFFDKKKAGVGALFDMGVYAVANLVACLGQAKSVSAKLATLGKPTKLEDTAVMTIEFKNGVVATAETSWCDPARTNSLTINGSQGKLTFPGTNQQPLDMLKPRSSVRERCRPIMTHPKVKKGMSQHEEWFQCIKKGSRPAVSNVHTALHVTEILVKAMQSNRQGRPVRLRTTI